MNAQELGFAVLRLRRIRRWTQQQLAAEAGVSKSSVRRIERGDRLANTRTLERVATALGLGLSMLLAPAEAIDPTDAPIDRRSNRDRRQRDGEAPLA